MAVTGLHWAAPWSSGLKILKSVLMQWRIQGGGGGGPCSPLFLNQTEARRAEKNVFWDRPPLSQGLYDRPPPLSERLNPPLLNGHTLLTLYWRVYNLLLFEAKEMDMLSFEFLWSSGLK